MISKLFSVESRSKWMFQSSVVGVIYILLAYQYIIRIFGFRCSMHVNRIHSLGFSILGIRNPNTRCAWAIRATTSAISATEMWMWCSRKKAFFLWIDFCFGRIQFTSLLPLFARLYNWKMAMFLLFHCQWLTTFHHVERGAGPQTRPHNQIWLVCLEMIDRNRFPMMTICGRNFFLEMKIIDDRFPGISLLSLNSYRIEFIGNKHLLVILKLIA